MPEIVRAALVQQAWTGDKDSMTAAAAAHIATAASAGAQVVCLQELFYGPYFCQVQDADYYGYTEAIPDGPTTRLMQDLARQHHIVIIAPMYEEEQPGLYYNTAAVIDADGQLPRASTGRTTCRRSRGSGRSSTSARATSATRSSTPPSAGSASTSATTGTSRKAGGRSAWPARGSCSTRRPLQPRALVLPVEAGAARRRGRQRVLRRRDQPGRRRAARRQRLLRPVLLRRPARPARRRRRLRQRRRGRGARPRHGPADRGQGPVAVLPGPPPRLLRGPGQHRYEPR